jgi:hypothetical protein
MKLRVHQNPLFGNLGNCIIDPFIKAEIMTKTKMKIGKKKTINVIKVEYTDLTIFYNRDFPRISDHNRKTRIEINRSKDHHVFIKKQPKQYINKGKVGE